MDKFNMDPNTILLFVSHGTTGSRDVDEFIRAEYRDEIELLKNPVKAVSVQNMRKKYEKT